MSTTSPVSTKPIIPPPPYGIGQPPSTVPTDPLELAERELRTARRHLANSAPPRHHREALCRAESRLIEAASDREDELDRGPALLKERPDLHEAMSEHVLRLWSLAEETGALCYRFLPRSEKLELLDDLIERVSACRWRETEAYFEAYWCDLGAGD